MTKFTGYSLFEYGRMVTDAPRFEAYAAALRQAISSRSIVVDLGAGAGIFALLAARFGAATVHAVDPMDAVVLARAFAAANGVDNRVQVQRCLSTELELSSRADVIVSDLRGITPFLQQHIPAIVDARARLLAPGGVLIPHHDRLQAALLADPEQYSGYDAPWAEHWCGLDLRAGREYVVNSTARVRATAAQLCSEPATWATLDYNTVTSPNAAGVVTLTATRSETIHGVAIWFDTELADGVGFSNRPGSLVRTYGQLFLPFTRPVQVAEGDAVEVELRASLIGEHYVWQWNTVAPGAHFEQSTFRGEIIDPDTLALRHPAARPTMDEAGRADAFILARMDGTASLVEVAAAAYSAFPQHFADLDDALGRVGDFAVKYAVKR